MAKSRSPRWSGRESSAEAGERTIQKRAIVLHGQEISCRGDGWPGGSQRAATVECEFSLHRLGSAGQAASRGR